MNRELLEREFDDSQLKTKKGNFGNSVSYLKGTAIIARLNESLDGLWSFDVLEHKIFEDEVVVLGKLSAEGITKTQFGNTKITRNKDTGELVSIGDDLKAASTDALKKCATLLGVGLYLYDSNGNGSNGKPRSQPQNHSEDAGNGSGNGRLTNKQLQAIYSIGKSKNMSQKSVKDHSLETFNKVPDYLTKEEASTLIQELQAM